MTLTPGTRLGSYEILTPLGAGGMGEVYRARDAKLKRDVAIKVLCPSFAEDNERVSRFEREAEVLASLNHSNIAIIHDVQRNEDRPFLVMELVEGLTLSERLQHGPMNLEDTLHAAKQIADALAVAHEKGVVHRDLKPANVKITDDGKIKVLDFGLAKFFESQSSPQLSNSPTLLNGTMAGTILGTAAYMSPEQAFPGENVSDTIAAVIRGEPEWNKLPSTVPSRLASLIQRSLKKDPRQRIHDAADLRNEIEDIINAPSTETPVVAKRSWHWMMPLVSLLIGATIATMYWYPRAGRSANGTSMHFSITIPEALRPLERRAYLHMALSPDGKTFVFRAGDRNQLFIRSIDQHDARLVEGTDGAAYPFFSPDSQFVGFLADFSRELKKVAVSGGAPIVICPLPGTGFGGASWATPETIVFSPAFASGLWSVSAHGGTPKLLLEPDRKKEITGYNWPQVLPDGKTILFTLSPGRITSFDDAHIMLLEAGATEPRLLIQGGSYARYLPTGHIAFSRGGSLLAMKFDLSTLQTIGTAFPVVSQVPSNLLSGAGFYSASSNGTLVYYGGPPLRGSNKLALVDRRGQVQYLTDSSDHWNQPSLSFDGKRAMVTLPAANDNVWLFDLASRSETRFTFEPGDEGFHEWSHDDKRVAFGWRFSGNIRIRWKPSDNSNESEELISGESPRYPASFSPDGKMLAFVEINATKRRDIWLLALADRTAKALFATEADECEPRFSPNGRWLAYVSNDTGRHEVYIQAVSGGPRKQVTRSGGAWPVWSRDSKELFFVSGDTMMTASVNSQTGNTENPTVLFKADYLLTFGNARDERPYDVMPDGQHFITSILQPDPGPAEYKVIINWFDELNRLTPR